MVSGARSARALQHLVRHQDRHSILECVPTTAVSLLLTEHLVMVGEVDRQLRKF